MEAIFTPPRLGCKARFSGVFQLAAVQTPVLSSPSSVQGWAVSAKHVAMQQVARETWVAFERRLKRAQVSAAQRPDHHKWIRHAEPHEPRKRRPKRWPPPNRPKLSQPPPALFSVSWHCVQGRHTGCTRAAHLFEVCASPEHPLYTPCTH